MSFAAAKAMVEIWERSPHSARKVRVKASDSRSSARKGCWHFQKKTAPAQPLTRTSSAWSCPPVVQLEVTVSDSYHFEHRFSQAHPTVKSLRLCSTSSSSSLGLSRSHVASPNKVSRLQAFSELAIDGLPPF